jgi:hypothetical protein
VLEGQWLPQWQGLYLTRVQESMSYNSLWQQCTLQSWISHTNMLLSQRTPRQPSSLMYWSEMYNSSRLCFQSNMWLSYIRVIRRRQRMYSTLQNKKSMCSGCSLYCVQSYWDMCL